MSNASSTKGVVRPFNSHGERGASGAEKTHQEPVKKDKSPRHFNVSAMPGSSSSFLVGELFSKADRLIMSGKNRPKCVKPAGCALAPLVMAKYSDNGGNDCVHKLDSHVEAIIQKYSAPMAFSETEHVTKYPLYPLRTSPTSFTPTYPEGLGGLGRRSNTIGNFSCMGESTANRPSLEKKAFNSRASEPQTSKKAKGNESVKFCTKKQTAGAAGVWTKAPTTGSQKPAPASNHGAGQGHGTGQGNNASVGKKKGPSGCNHCGINTVKPKPCNKSSNKLMTGRPQCPCESVGESHSQPSLKTDTQCREPVRSDCGEKQNVSPCQEFTANSAKLQQPHIEKQGDGHGEPSGNKRKKTKMAKRKPRHIVIEEAKKVYKENQLLKFEGMELRQEMECTRKGLMLECAKVLHSVLTFCEEKSKKANNLYRDEGSQKKCTTTACPSTKKGAGCSTGMCGGYTPSGWNKANAHKGAEDSDCLPPRTQVPPCPARGGGEENTGRQEGQDAVTSGVVDCNMCPSVRILGEMAFQLERRILEYVFGAEGKSKRRFYGYTVSNVCYMITKESAAPSGKTDSIGKSDKACRFEKIMSALQKYGYNVKIHPEFSQTIVNKFGVLACPPDQCTIDSFRLQDACAMSALISRLCGSPSEVASLNILLRCLSFLARCDGKPMFVW